MTNIRCLAIAGSLLMLSGCASFQVGNDFNLTRFAASIEHGVTTRAEVRQWLGEPQNTGVVVNRDGEQLERWLYFHGQGKLGNVSATRMKTLEIQFDGDGVVRAYDWIGQ